MNESLATFRDRHIGQTAWLFGKGPSLDPFLDGGFLASVSATPHQVLCAVNETVRDITGAPYAFACDNCLRWQHLYHPGVILFQPARLLREDIRHKPATPPCETILFEDRAISRIPSSITRWLDEGLAALPGTITAALQILRIMGIRRIVCIGIDGGLERSRRPWLTEPVPPGCSSYNEIRAAFIKAAGEMQTELVFWSPENHAAILENRAVASICA